MNPCFACSGSKFPILLTTVARMSNDAEIPINPRAIALKFIVPAPNLLDSMAKPETTPTRSARIPVIAPKIAIASHNLPLSIKVKTITAPTSKDIASTKFLIALTFTLKAKPLRYLPKPSNASPAPESTSPIPSIGLASFSNAFAIFIMAKTIPPLRAAARIVPQSMLLMSSNPLVTIPFRVSQTIEAPF